MKKFDEAVFTWINGFAGRSTLLDGLMVFISSSFIYILIGIVVVAVFIQRKRKLAFIGISALLLGVIIKYIITFFYDRPRPFLQLDTTLLIDKAPSASFPSMTAMLAFAAATAIWKMNKRIGWVAICMAVLVAISRIFVGHHYLTDVIAGSVIGVLFTWICLKMFDR